MYNSTKSSTWHVLAMSQSEQTNGSVAIMPLKGFGKEEWVGELSRLEARKEIAPGTNKISSRSPSYQLIVQPLVEISTYHLLDRRNRR